MPIVAGSSLKSLKWFEKNTEGQTLLSTESGHSMSGRRRYCALESLSQRRLAYCSFATLTSKFRSHRFNEHLRGAVTTPPDARVKPTSQCSLVYLPASACSHHHAAVNGQAVV